MLNKEEIQGICKGNPYIIADTHFYHKNIGEYCHRPTNWQELIINNWNSIIRKNSTVIHLGDYSFGSLAEIRELTSNLNGKIYLLKGNHDRHSNKFYESCGIIIIPHKTFIYLDYTISHYPLYNFTTKYNIHGHTHNNLYDKLPGHINISVEMMNYKPIRLLDIMPTLIKNKNG